MRVLGSRIGIYTFRALVVGASAAFLTAGLQAQDYQWNGSVNAGWATTGNWTPSGVPNGSDDNVLGLLSGVTSAFTNLNTNTGDATRTVGNFSLGSGTWQLQSVNVAAYSSTLDIQGNLDVSGGTLFFRNFGGTTTVLVGGTATIAGGTAQFGIDTGVDMLNTVQVSGLTTVGGGGIMSVHAATSQFDGGILMDGGTVNLLAGSNPDTRTVSTAFVEGSTGTVQVASASPSTGQSLATLAINGNGTDKTYAGTVTDGAPSTILSITKSGTGIQRLTGSNSYSGATTINGGSLLVSNTSGSGTGSGSILVNNGGLLGGTGSISGGITLQAGGQISPGDDTTPADFSLAAGSLLWSSDDSTAGMVFGLGTNTDTLDLAGSFTRGSGSVFIFELSDSGGAVAGDTYTLLTFASSDFDVSDFASIGLEGDFTLNGDNLQFTIAVPEPSVSGLFGLGLAAFVGLRVSRKRLLGTVG